MSIDWEIGNKYKKIISTRKLIIMIYFNELIMFITFIL